MLEKFEHKDSEEIKKVLGIEIYKDYRVKEAVLTYEVLINLVDYKNGEFFWKNHPKYGSKKDKKAGAKKDKHGYIRLGYKRRYYLVHRLVWLWHHKVYPKGVMDHINGDRSDNRIENLRIVSVRANGLNKLLHREGRLPGASYCKRHKKWKSSIWLNKKRHSLGSFETELEAHNAYMSAYDKYETLENEVLQKYRKSEG